MDRSINVSDFVRDLKFSVVNHKDIKNYGKIYFPSISRAGIEIATLRPSSYLSERILVWSKTESIYLESVGTERASLAVRSVLRNKPPLLLLTKRFSSGLVEDVIKIASELDIPVVHTKDMSFSELLFAVNPYLLNKFAPSEQIHASLVNINGVGVLIIGESGIGKSEAVLELLQRNYVFVADDAVIIKRLGERFYGKAAPIILDLLEIRGIGIIDIRLLFGAKNIREESSIDLVVELVSSKIDEIAALERLGSKFLSFDILGGSLPKIQIMVKEGRSIASLIEAATGFFLAHNDSNLVLEKIAFRSKLGDGEN